jgi:hypothetical protein
LTEQGPLVGEIRNEDAFDALTIKVRDACLGVVFEELREIDDNQLSIGICMGVLLAAARLAVAAKAADVPAETMGEAFIAMARDAAKITAAEARSVGQGGTGSRA